MNAYQQLTSLLKQFCFERMCIEIEYFGNIHCFINYKMKEKKNTLWKLYVPDKFSIFLVIVFNKAVQFVVPQFMVFLYKSKSNLANWRKFQYDSFAHVRFIANIACFMCMRFEITLSMRYIAVLPLIS